MFPFSTRKDSKFIGKYKVLSKPPKKEKKNPSTVLQYGWGIHSLSTWTYYHFFAYWHDSICFSSFQYTFLTIATFLILHKCNILCQIINIASPKLKKRYRSFTASAYACIIWSLPANALTSITSVDSGRWKFGISASIPLN